MMRRVVASKRISRTVVSGSAVVCAVRSQYMQAPGKRDQEAFLAQYQPLDVLCLGDSCSASEVHEAHKRLAAKYGPQGATPDPKMLERVNRAHDVLSDPQSPYYTRAHTSDSDRQRLQFEMLPPTNRRAIKIQVGIAGVFVACVFFMVVYMALKPMKNVKRAATR